MVWNVLGNLNSPDSGGGSGINLSIQAENPNIINTDRETVISLDRKALKRNIFSHSNIFKVWGVLEASAAEPAPAWFPSGCA